MGDMSDLSLTDYVLDAGRMGVDWVAGKAGHPTHYAADALADQLHLTDDQRDLAVLYESYGGFSPTAIAGDVKEEAAKALDQFWWVPYAAGAAVALLVGLYVLPFVAPFVTAAARGSK